MQRSPHVVDSAIRGTSENYCDDRYGPPTDALRLSADARLFAYHSDTSRMEMSTAPLATVASGVENATRSRISRPDALGSVLLCSVAESIVFQYLNRIGILRSFIRRESKTFLAGAARIFGGSRVVRLFFAMGKIRGTPCMRRHILLHPGTTKYFSNSFVFKNEIEKEGLPRDSTPALGVTSPVQGRVSRSKYPALFL
jgi:hypothetical protein